MKIKLNIKNVVQCYVQRCSDTIREIKQTELRDKKKPINPFSDQWSRYEQWKREASEWLTAIKLIKHFEKTGKSLKGFKYADALAANGLFNHLRGVPHGKGDIMPTRKRINKVRAIHRRVLKIGRQLDRHGSDKWTRKLEEQYAPIAAWVVKMQERAELKRKEATANAHA